MSVFVVFSLIHALGLRILKENKNSLNIALAPAAIETYSRLLVYVEIESLGIKGFVSKCVYVCV